MTSFQSAINLKKKDFFITISVVNFRIHFQTKNFVFKELQSLDKTGLDGLCAVAACICNRYMYY